MMAVIGCSVCPGVGEPHIHPHVSHEYLCLLPSVRTSARILQRNIDNGRERQRYGRLIGGTGAHN